MKRERPVLGALALIAIGMVIGLLVSLAWVAFSAPDAVENDAVLDARAAHGQR